MSKYRFSECEKVAIWTADGRKCFYERTPVHYDDLQIDHIVPEGITEAKLAELRPILPPNFEINSVENWATCQQGCNRRKGANLFETKPLLYYVHEAKKRAPKVQEMMKSFQIARDNDKLLSGLAVAVEQGHLSTEQVFAVLRSISPQGEAQNDPWVISFGVNFHDPLPQDATEQGPELSSWLIKRLLHDLTQTGAVFLLIDEERTGETVSARCAFWTFDFDRITQDIDFCWDVLAVQKYSELFADEPTELFDRAIVSRYHATVNKDPGDPVGFSVCPSCGSRDLQRGSFFTEDETVYIIRCRECGHSETS